MKYSLELSSPWIPQYHKNLEEYEIELNSEDHSYITKGWLADSSDAMSNLLSGEATAEFLQKYGYDMIYKQPLRSNVETDKLYYDNTTINSFFTQTFR